jgi:hypothetical protein
MKIEARQHNFFDPNERLFYIKGRLHGMPFEGLHLYIGSSATMQIRALSVFDVVEARGPK